MSVSEVDKYIIQELKTPFSAEANAEYSKSASRILWLDENVVPGSPFQMNCSWYLKPDLKELPVHTHEAPELLGFFGNDPEDPYNLHGEIELGLGDQKYIINKTSMVFVPAGLKHYPLIVKRVERPIFHFSVLKSGRWHTSASKESPQLESNYGKYIVTELETPAFPPEFVENYKKFATRILYMDKNVCPGAFQMNVAWYRKPTNHAPFAHAHDHDEVIAFFGGNAADPYNLNGEVEMWMGDKQNMLTRSTMLFAPKGMKHCPLIIHRADMPIFHFSIVAGGTYEISGQKFGK
jgi:hypothetical protein